MPKAHKSRTNASMIRFELGQVAVDADRRATRWRRWWNGGQLTSTASGQARIDLASAGKFPFAQASWVRFNQIVPRLQSRPRPRNKLRGQILLANIYSILVRAPLGKGYTVSLSGKTAKSRDSESASTHNFHSGTCRGVSNFYCGIVRCSLLPQWKTQHILLA